MADGPACANCRDADLLRTPLRFLAVFAASLLLAEAGHAFLLLRDAFPGPPAACSAGNGR